MLRTAFDRQLQTLQDDIVSMGSAVRTNIVRATDALRRGNVVVARQIIRDDEAINDQRIALGMKSLQLIATQQPLAGDMRFIAAVLEIIGELERIHDYAKGIARSAIDLERQPAFAVLLERMPEMAALAAGMLDQALEAFVRRDVALARRIPQLDNAVDTLFNTIYADIIRHITANPHSAEACNLIEWSLHNLERAADRVINICEWVVFMVTNVYSELDGDADVLPPVNR